MNDWPTMRLGDVCIAKSGNSKIIKGTLPTKNDGTLFPAYSATGQDVFSEGYDFNGDGIVISAVGARCGKCFLANGKWRAIANTHVVLPKTDKANIRFLWYLLNDESFWVRGGTAQPFVKVGDSLKKQIAVPPLMEQVRIVKLLDEADRLRKLRDQADHCTANLIPALFHEMFVSPDESRSWPVTTLGDLVKFVGGGTPSRARQEFFEGAIPWATSKDVKTDYMSDTQEHITDDAIQASATNLVPANSVLLVVKSKILMHSLPVAITTVPMCFGQDLKGLVCGNKVFPEFIASFLRTKKDAILAQARGANTEGLTLDILRVIKISLPPLPLQKEFAQRVTEIRALEAEQTTSRTRLEALFQSMLHRAFNGEL